MSERIHPLRRMLKLRSEGVKCGIPSYCTGNELAIEIALRRAKELQTPVLIEATANQSNQFGGYTGMKPADFYNKVMCMAKNIGLDEDMLILAGDHLGPLTWQDKPECEAMALSEELVYQYVRAGFTKIHLDTSMKLKDDPDGILKTETIARRGVALYKVCMQAYEELLREKPEALRPVFVIGSEVPIPGGAQELEEGLSVTKPEAFVDTVNTYTRMFAEAGVPDGMKDVIAVVVQPGVEFGDAQVFDYDRAAAKALCECLAAYPSIILEGHSTDYQTKEKLREMVEDGIAILKVGPALTYGLREALFALSMIEKELVPIEEQAGLMEALEAVMLENPKNWMKHYHGNERELELARKYSFSDRVRYYIGDARIHDRIEQLFGNLRKHPIPLSMLHQYMPLQYAAVRAAALQNEPRELALNGIAQFMLEYEYAAGRIELA